MRGLTIIVAEAVAARMRSALSLALTTCALGGRVRLFLDAAAVPLLAGAAEDDELVAAGLPSLATLIADAAEAGVELIACQSGLALHGLSAERIGPPWQWGGMVSVMAGLGEERLVIA